MSDEKETILRKNGILFRSILNDLKRDEATAARELNLELNTLQEMLNGMREIPYDVIQKAAAIWPVNKRDFFLVHDDTEHDLLLFKKEKSFESRRTLSRGGIPYYEYRDTAMSRLAHFRPEWIEMLVQTEDQNPLNSSVQWNKGHFLYQFTFFIGSINYYYEAKGEKICMPMQTGDSVFGLPYYPHSFTKREKEKAFILALTFGNRLMGDVQQELIALGPDKAEQFCLSTFSFSALLFRACEDANLTLEELSSRSSIPTGQLSLFLQGSKSPSFTEIEIIAEALRIGVRELLPTVGDTQSGIRFLRYPSAPKWLYPSAEMPLYRFTELAKSSYVPGMHPLLIEPLSTQETESFIQTSLHQYGYHIGEHPLILKWACEGVFYTKTLFPGDSFYLKPFVLHSFTNEKKSQVNPDTPGLQNSLLILRISGKLASDEITEASLLGPQTIRRFVSDAEKWYA